MLCNTEKELDNSGQELGNADGLTGSPAEAEQETQFLVKWAGRSHIHNTWETGELGAGVEGRGLCWVLVGSAEGCVGCWWGEPRAVLGPGGEC